MIKAILISIALVLAVAIFGCSHVEEVRSAGAAVFTEAPETDVSEPEIIARDHVISMDEPRRGHDLKLIDSVHGGCDSCWRFIYEFRDDDGTARVAVDVKEGEVFDAAVHN